MPYILMVSECLAVTVCSYQNSMHSSFVVYLKIYSYTIGRLEKEEAEAFRIGSATPISFAGTGSQSQRNDACSDETTYLDFRFIVSTSNICDRSIYTLRYTLYLSTN